MARRERERHIRAMPFSSVSRLSAAAALLACAACDLSTPTEVQRPLDLELDFCANDVPVWFAFQNQDEPQATRLLPDAEGTFRFTASNRVIVGMVWQRGADYHTQIVYATNEELASMSGVGCLEEFGARTVNGTVSGVGAGQIAVVSMNYASVPLQGGNTSFALTNLPDRPLDVVASRQTVSGNTRVADRVILRRTQTFVNNGTMPVLDFTNGADALAAVAVTTNVSGILSGEFAYLQNNLFSQLETSHSLSYVDGLGNGSTAVAALPQTALASGEYHDLILLAINATTGGIRGAENFFRAPSTQTLFLGPPLGDPSISVIPNAEYVRLRLQLPAQLSYDDAVSVAYSQQLSFSVITVTLVATAGFYRGTPAIWVLEIPDLTGAPGWQDAWGLRAGTEIDWSVTAFRGRGELLFGAKPEDGEFVRYAIRQSIPGAAAPAALRRNGSLGSVYTSRLRLRQP